MKEIILVGIIFLTSYFLTMGARVVSRRRNLIDVPNGRSLHQRPTPRIGGVAIVLTWYIGITMMYLGHRIEQSMYFALLSGVLLAVVSFVDDVVDIRPSIRLLVHIATAMLALRFLGGLRPVELFGRSLLPTFVLYPLVIAGIVWFINLYNFLDGIDGYAAIEAVCVSAAMLLFTGDFVNAVLIASVLGFLVWNWPTAKIFMGDAGSTQLGFILVVLGIHYHNAHSFSIFWWLILTAPFWFDATITLLRRMLNHEILSEGHSKHVYQRLVQSGFSHLKVDWMLISINVFLIALVYSFIEFELMKVVLLLVAIIILYSLTVYTDRRKPFHQG